MNANNNQLITNATLRRFYFKFPVWFQQSPLGRKDTGTKILSRSKRKINKHKDDHCSQDEKNKTKSHNTLSWSDLHLGWELYSLTPRPNWHPICSNTNK